VDEGDAKSPTQQWRDRWAASLCKQLPIVLASRVVRFGLIWPACCCDQAAALISDATIDTLAAVWHALH
jgi:hypothetical protein